MAPPRRFDFQDCRLDCRSDLEHLVTQGERIVYVGLDVPDKGADGRDEIALDTVNLVTSVSASRIAINQVESRLPQA
jgi:hypothetical protein